jgi:AbrB family looped-hinge helix DNA binding protein
MRTIDQAALDGRERAALDAAARLSRERFTALQGMLFGSRARGEGDAESDLDLLILTARGRSTGESDRRSSMLCSRSSSLTERLGISAAHIAAASTSCSWTCRTPRPALIDELAGWGLGITSKNEVLLDMSTQVTRKGQVTIPKRVRDRLNIKPGSSVEFELAADGRVVLVKVGGRRTRGRSAFARIRGAATVRMTTEEIMALTRGDDWAVILIDTNVLLDVLTNNPSWADWSQRQLEAAALRDRLAINLVIYAELSVGFARIEEVDGVLSATDIAVADIPRPALFLAGKAFQAYRKRGGAATGVLPDFFIGAHAAVLNVPLLTRDTARYRTYFPTTELIAPTGTWPSSSQNGGLVFWLWLSPRGLTQNPELTVAFEAHRNNDAIGGAKAKWCRAPRIETELGDAELSFHTSEKQDFDKIFLDLGYEIC